FFIYDFYEGGWQSANKMVPEPTIIGPTDENGEVVIDLEYPRVSSGFYIVELGKLKDKNTTFDIHPSIFDVLVGGSVRDLFEIPGKYKIIKNDQFHTTTGMYDCVDVGITKNDIANFLDDPENYEKRFVFTNETEGKIKIRKTDSVTADDVEGATYGIFEYGVHDSDGTEEGEVDNPNAETEEVTKTTETTIDPDDVNETEPADEDDGSVSVGGDEGDSDITSTDDTEVKPIATLVTKSGEYTYSKLLPTGRYYLLELGSPKTHALDTQKHEFEIKPGMNTDETALEINLVDKPTYIEYNKLEASSLDTNGQQIAGAVIRIYEKPSEGEIDYDTAKAVYEFTTSSNPESIIGVLETDKTYIAHEVKTPDGYATSKDKEFTVSIDGSVDKVDMYDETIKGSFSKTDMTGTKELADCHMKLNDDTANEEVESWVSTDKPHIIEG
ncbi:MAG: hypothetical protein J1E41_08130, partial [Ruminococcus sp.]|nr:hypothetical protein [Ruminococcus sp.]